MIVTIFAILFLLFMGAMAVFGYSMIMKKAAAPDEINTEKCSVCRNRFERSALVLREIGDYKLLFFCKDCIIALYNDAAKNE